MAIQLFSKVSQAKKILKIQLALSRVGLLSSSTAEKVPRGRMAVYVGDVERKRYVVPVSYLNQPSFLDLLKRAEEEIGFHHLMGGLTIPCREEIFVHLTSQFKNPRNMMK